MKHSHANDKNRGANAHIQILNTPTAGHSRRTHTYNNKVGGKERFLDELQKWSRVWPSRLRRGVGGGARRRQRSQVMVCRPGPAV